MDDQAAAQQAQPEAPASAGPAAQSVRGRSGGQQAGLARAGQQRPAEQFDAGVDLRVSREEAERIIRRALELQDAQQAGPDVGLSMSDVQDIARQLGVDTSLVRRARTEMRVASQSEGGMSRAGILLGPRHATAARLVQADAAVVRSAAAEWMTRDEGMTRTGTRGGADRWVRDKRLLVSLRRGLQADRGSGVLRDLDAVAVTVTADAEGSIVTVEADTSKIRNAGAVIAVTGAGISLGIGAGAAALWPDSALFGLDAAQFAAAAVPSLAITAVTTMAVTRSWTRKVREGIDQAIDGITMTTSSPQLPPLRTHSETGWRATVLRWLGGQG